MRQVFAAATLGALILIQPLRTSFAESPRGLRVEPERIVKTLSFSNREFASGHSSKGVRTSSRRGQS
jgi:hypothetical protein